jgi:thymidylate synthase (FAD)
MDYVVPKSIENDIELLNAYDNIYQQCEKLYADCIKLGVPAEDARYCVPSGIKSNITITMNARELRHFFNLRCCKRAQWEIREVAWSMLRHCKSISEAIFDKAGPICFERECPEGDKKCYERTKQSSEQLHLL